MTGFSLRWVIKVGTRQNSGELGGTPNSKLETRNLTLTPHSWLIWLVSAVTLTIVARNPLVSGVMLLVAGVVYQRVRPRGIPLPLNWLRLGGVMLILPALFFTLSLHSGDTVILTLPTSWPLVGGSLTAEAGVLGASNGLLLLTLLALFAVFNRAVAPHDLIRLTPRAFHQLGLVVLIALTYVPETLAQWQRIREAQAIRGYEPQGWRDWRPLLLPLLITGLERAMDVAEAMVARGYGATTNKPQSVWRQAMLLVGLAAAFLGWLLYLAHNRWGWVLLAGGISLLLVLVWQAGQNVKTTRYQTSNWHPIHSFILIATLLPWLTLLWIPSTSLSYMPFPRLMLPLLQPVFTVSLLLFLAPLLNQIKPFSGIDEPD